MENPNVKTFTTLIYGTTTQTIFSGESTILSGSFLQKNVASETQLKCGNDLVFNNFARDANFEMFYLCDANLRIIKTGQDEAQVVINYLPYKLTTTSAQHILPFSEGEVLIAMLLIMGLFLIGLNGVLNFIRKK